MSEQMDLCLTQDGKRTKQHMIQRTKSLDPVVFEAEVSLKAFQCVFFRAPLYLFYSLREFLLKL